MAGTYGTQRAHHGPAPTESPGGTTPRPEGDPNAEPIIVKPRDLDAEEAELRARLARAEQLRRLATLRRDVAAAVSQAEEAMAAIPDAGGAEGLQDNP